MKIKIINWEEYNPRSDRKSHSWFRLNNDFLFDQKFFSFTPLEKQVWVYLMGFCSKEKGLPFDLDVDYLEHHSKIKGSVIHSAIKKLVKVNCIEILDGKQQPDTSVLPDGNQPGTDGSPTDVRTDERTNNTNEALPHLAVLWNEHSAEKLPKVRSCCKTRRAHSRDRWDENPYDDYWKQVIARINASDFCNGVNYHGWIADFDFFVAPENKKGPASHIRVLEGKYDNRSKAKSKKAAAPSQDALEKLKQRESEAAKECTLKPDKVRELIARARKPLNEKPPGPGAA